LPTAWLGRAGEVERWRKERSLLGECRDGIEDRVEAGSCAVAAEGLAQV